MKSFWNRSTCRVHVFTRLCFLLWILGIQKQKVEADQTALERIGPDWSGSDQTRLERTGPDRTGGLWDLRQAGCVGHAPPLSLVQPLVEEGAENVDSLCLLFF